MFFYPSLQTYPCPSIAVPSAEALSNWTQSNTFDFGEKHSFHDAICLTIKIGSISLLWFGTLSEVRYRKLSMPLVMVWITLWKPPIVLKTASCWHFICNNHTITTLQFARAHMIEMQGFIKTYVPTILTHKPSTFRIKWGMLEIIWATVQFTCSWLTSYNPDQGMT